MAQPPLTTGARIFAVVAVIAGAWAAFTAWTGGGVWQIGSVVVTSRTPWRPLILAILATAASLWLAGAAWRQAMTDRTVRWGAAARATAAGAGRLVPSASILALVLAGGVAASGWAYGSKTASGPDSFAYVSQAALWRTGRLDIPIPLASRAPWPDAATTFAPFGYRASVDGRAIVPITAPGVPMMMAALQALAGHCAAFLVTPLSAALLVWITFVIGRQIHSTVVGLAAAWLVATSPAFLFMLMWPMTDIAAAAAAAAMTTGLLRGGIRPVMWAGVAAAAGILIRPNFVVVAAAAGAWLVIDALVEGPDRRTRLARVGVFSLLIVPGIAVTAWLNTRWFGSALSSGYGTTGELLSVDRVLINASRYTSWIVETSPLALAGLVALTVPISAIWGGRAGWRAPLLFVFTAAATTSIYLVYQSFTDWWYLRFLLPAWPALWLGAAVLLVGATTRWRAAFGLGILITLVTGVAGIQLSRERGIVGLGEERYVSVANLVAASTEPNAVILTWQHSGTVRYYGGRETVRFDLLDAAWLDRTIAWLQARGRHPYVLVEDWELPLFRERFAAANTAGRLDFQPAASWESTRVDGRVFLFDPINLNRDGTADPGAVLERQQPRCAPSTFPRLAHETRPAADGATRAPATDSLMAWWRYGLDGRRC